MAKGGAPEASPANAPSSAPAATQRPARAAPEFESCVPQGSRREIENGICTQYDELGWPSPRTRPRNQSGAVATQIHDHRRWRLFNKESARRNQQHSTGHLGSIHPRGSNLRQAKKEGRRGKKMVHDDVGIRLIPPRQPAQGDEGPRVSGQLVHLPHRSVPENPGRAGSL